MKPCRHILNSLEVKDSRLVGKSGQSIRRRRYCEKCDQTLTTYELKSDIVKELERERKELERLKKVIGNYTKKYGS